MLKLFPFPLIEYYTEHERWLFVLAPNKNYKTEKEVLENYVWAFPRWDNINFRCPTHKDCWKLEQGDIWKNQGDCCPICNKIPPKIYLRMWKTFNNLKYEYKNLHKRLT